MCPIFEFAIVNWPACMVFTSFKVLLSYPQMDNAQETPELSPGLPRPVPFVLYWQRP